MIKKVVVAVLAFVMTFGAVAPGVLAASEAIRPYSVQNGVLEYKINQGNGRFTIQTADGQPGKPSDNDLSLLFMRDELPNTSFTTFRIDGQDYIFGNDYGPLGGVVSSTVVNGLTAKTIWRVKDVEVTQALQLISDLSNPNVGYVRLSYQVANGSASRVELGARMLLDTQLGENDAAPMVIGTSYITNETEYAGENMPVTWKSADQQFAPNVIAYGLLSGWGNLAPDRLVVAHWQAISATKWDYQADPLRNFTTNKNAYRSADSAVAMYYQPSVLATGASRTYETYYGIGSLSDSVGEANFTVQLNSPQKLTVNAAGSGYDEDSFTITASIDNSGGTSVDLNNLTVKLGLSDELTLADDEADTKTISALKKGDTTSLSFRVVPEVCQSLAVAEYGVTITYGDGQYLEASKYVILPSVKGEVPEMQMTEVAPTTLYTAATKKSVVIKGSAFDSLKADNEWSMYITNTRTGEEAGIPRKDIYIDDSSLTVQLDDQLRFSVGEYEIGIRSQYFGHLSRKLNFTNDPDFDRVEYGVLLIGDFSEDNVHDVQLLKSEEEIATLAADAREKILLTIRGEITTYELDGVTYYDCASGSIINNAVMYTAPLDKPQSAMSICRYNGRTEGWSKFANYSWFGNQDQSLVVAGDGNLSVGDYNFHYGSFYITLVDDNEYVLAEVDDGNNIDINPNVGEVPDDETSPVTIITPANVIANEAFKLTGALTGMKISINNAVIGKETVSLGGSVSLALPWMQLEDGDGDDGGSKPDSKHPGFEKVDKANDVMGADSLVALNLEELRYGVNAADNPADLVGIKAQGEINLTDDALPLLEAGGAKAGFAIDSINYDGYYTMMEAGVKVGDVFECNAKVSLVFETGGSCIPDDIELVLGGEVMKIPLGAGAFQVGWLTKMGGGVYNLYDTIRGNYNVIPPFSMKLITGYADPTTVALELDTISMEVGIGRIRFEAEDGKIVKLPLLEKMYAGFMIYCTEVDGVIYPCVDISAGIDINLLDILKGSGSIWLVSDPRIDSIFGHLSVGGKVYVGVFIPSFIPVVGGLELAAIMAELSTYRVYAGIRVLGIPLSIGYYWADKKVKFNDSWGLDDYQSAFNIPEEELENALALQYVAGGDTNADGVMLFGSNLRVTYRSDEVPALFGVDTTRHQIAVDNQDYSLFQVQYDGELPQITVTDPAGEAYALVENENYRLQTIAAEESQSGVEEHYVYITVTEPMDGIWTIESDVPTTVTGMDVLELPEVQVECFSQSGNSLIANWDARDIAEGYTVDVHLSQAQPEMTGLAAEQVSAMSEVELADYYREQADNYDVGIRIAAGLDAAAGTASMQIPERVLDGEYQVRVVLKDAYGATVSSALSDERFQYVNPDTPAAASDVRLQAAGDGQFALSFAGTESADGYLVEVLDAEDQVIEGLTQTTTDTSLYIGNIYQAATGYDADGNPTGYQTVGTFPGNSYRVRVTAFAEKNLVKYESDAVTTDLVYLPVPDPAQLSLQVNNLTPTAASGASEVTINSNTAQVEVVSDQSGKLIYSLDGTFAEEVFTMAAGVPTTISLSLEEGGTNLAFTFVNDQGDYTSEKLSVSVDTTTPVLMLDQTVVESQSGAYTITGTAETGAAVYVNGQAAAVQNGKFNYAGSGNSSRQSISVQALDWAGNQTRMYCDVLPSELSRLVGLRVKANGQPIDPEQVVQLEKDDNLQLAVYGLAADGSEYLLDSASVDYSIVFGDGKVSIDETGKVTANTYGEAVATCEYAVTSDYRLEQSVAFEVASPTVQPDTIRVFSTTVAADLNVGDSVTALSVPNAPAEVFYTYAVSDNDYLAVQDNQLVLQARPTDVTEFMVTLIAQGHAFQAGQYVDFGAPIVKQVSFSVTQRVVSVAALRSFAVVTGVNFADLPLPGTVAARLSDDSVQDYPVTWSKGAYNSAVARTYTLRGELVLPDNVVNPSDLAAQLQVSVYRDDEDDEPEIEPADRLIAADRLTVNQQTSDTDTERVVMNTVTVPQTLFQTAAEQAARQQQPVIIALPPVSQSTDPVTTADGRPIVRKAKLSLTDGQVDMLAETGLIIRGAQGTEVELPPALLSGIGGSNTGLEVSQSDLSLALAQAEVAAAGQALAGQDIDTNFRGTTVLRFPVPEGASAADLRVHVRHSDGSEADLIPQTVTVAGRSYLEITIDHFSTFVIYQPGEMIKLTVGSKTAYVAGSSHVLEAAPYVDSNSSRTMVPIRFISEGLGAKVEWLAETRQVRVTSGDRSILLTIGSSLAVRNGQSLTIDAVAQIISGRTFVPLRLISEALGATVDYDAASKTVTIKR